MTINWNNNIIIYDNCSQTPCGTFYGFGNNAYVDVVNPVITSTSIQEIEWIIPFVMYSTSSAEQLIGHRNGDWYFPYFYPGGQTPIVYNGQGNQVGDYLNLNQKYWLKITRNYTNNTAQYSWSTDGITYTTYVTITFVDSGVQNGDPYRFGNSVYSGENQRWFNGSIFLSEVKCKVDGVNIPLFTSNNLNWNSDITFTGDFVISNEGYISGFKPDTYLTLGMSEVSGTNPSSALSMVFPIIRTSIANGRESQLGWKDKRWMLPKFLSTGEYLAAYDNTTGSNVVVSPTLNRLQLYYIKVDWDEGTGYRSYSYSTDGTNFTQYTSFNDTVMASETPSGPIYIGMGNPNSGETAQWFIGELDLANTKIYANGVEVPMVRPSPIIPEGTFNSKDITNAYIGSTQVTRMYLGSNLIYS